MSNFKMRRACSACGSEFGQVTETGAQDVVRCTCGRFQYNAPRTETGKAVRTVTTVHNSIKPKQRTRVLLRANGACELCHAGDKPLHVGHLLSVNDGLRMNLTDVELNDDENLAAMCDECNLGLSDRPITLRLLMSLLMARLRLGGAA